MERDEVLVLVEAKQRDFAVWLTSASLKAVLE